MDLILKRYQQLRVLFYKWYYKGHAVVDVPDPRDWLVKSSELRLGSGYDKWDLLPDFIFLYEIAKKLGVKFVWQDGNECTAYALIYAVKIAQTIQENKAVELDEEKQWQAQKKTGASDRTGDTLQHAMKTFIKNPQGSPIAQYRRVKPNRNVKDIVWEACMQITLGRPLYTGVLWKGNNWNNLVKTGYWEYVKGQIKGGHAVMVVGFDKEKKEFLIFQAIEKKFGDNDIGVFKIKFDQLEKLMSIYAIIPFDIKRTKE